MASFEKPKSQEVEKEAHKPEMAGQEIRISLPDIEKMKRHDLQEKKDHELAAMLQAHWAVIVQAEHRTNH